MCSGTMSDGSEITEEIREEVEEEYEEDFIEEDINLGDTSQEPTPRETGKGEHLTGNTGTVFVKDDIAASVAQTQLVQDSVETGYQSSELLGNGSLLEESAPTKSCRSNGANDTTAKPSDVINAFCERLAESVVREAILINEIYDRDKLSSPIKVSQSLDQGLEHETGTGSGLIPAGNYDSYMIERFLHSQADPEEALHEEESQKGPDHVTDGRYPGLDPSDNYVREELDSARKDDDCSDQNNNQMTAAMLDGLETIHEGLELDLHGGHVIHPGVEEAGAVSVDTKLPNQQETDRQTDDRVVDDAGNEGDAESNGEGELEQVMPDSGPVLPLRGILKVRQEERRHSAEGDGVPECTDGTQSAEEEKKAHKDEPGKQNRDDGIEEDEEDVEDCCEMTAKQKQRLVEAVREGDVGRLQELMQMRNASLDMLWFGESLLTVAVRAGQEEMALFLMDNGADWRFKTRLVEKADNGDVKVYDKTIRQLAYEQDLMNIVELLDFKTNNIFPFISPPRDRTLHLLEPFVPSEPLPLCEGELIYSECIDETVNEEGKINKNTKQMSDSEKDNDKLSKKKQNRHSSNEGDHILPLRHASNSSHRSSSDDLTQVFGPDLGYETTSPISSSLNQRHTSASSARDAVSVRGTRSFNLMKAHNSKTREVVDSSSDYPMFTNMNAPVGSYNFEKRNWSVVKSAPPSYNYSMESLQDASVRVGLPFVHGDNRKASVSSDAHKNNNRISQSAKNRSNVSPYDQVAKVLSENKLLSKNNKNKSSSSMFPVINGTQRQKEESFNTRISYIYANRGSPDPYSRLSASHRFPSHCVKPGMNLDILPKSKVKN